MERAYKPRHDRSAVYYAEDWRALRWPVWFYAVTARRSAWSCL
jgi:hypothetical protein